MLKTEIKWLWNVWKGNRLQAVANASFGILDVVIQMAQVWAVKHAVDVATHDTDGNVIFAVGIMLALIICHFGVIIANIWLKNILGVKAQNRMQQRLLDTLLRAKWQGKNQLHSGDVLNRLETDVKNVITFLTETLPSTVSTLLLFFCAFFYLFTMDRILAVIVVIMLPMFILLSKLYMRRMRRLNRDVRNSDSEVQSILTETVQNSLLIKTQLQESAMVQRLENTQASLRENVKERTKFSVISQLILNTGFSMTYIVAFGWSAVRLSAGTLTFGGMTAFLQLVTRVQIPARNLTRLIPQYVDVLTAVERLMQLEDNPLEEQGEQRVLDGPLGIKLENISFEYTDEETPKHVISDLNFDFKPQSCNVIVGETGSGKTTLLRLLLALIKPTAGKITIYNEKTGEELSPLHRINYVYVPQGNTILSGTIRDNLLLGRSDVNDNELHKVLKTACAEFVFELPKGINTNVSEDGIGLSEGQAQRIAIARALLRPGNIMIFDESTSAVDIDTEEQLLKNILSSQNKTVIFVTHRMSVCKYSDNTLTL